MQVHKLPKKMNKKKCQETTWENLHRLSEWLIRLGIIGAKIRAHFEPLGAYIAVMFDGFQGVPKWASVIAGCTPDHCTIFRQV